MNQVLKIFVPITILWGFAIDIYCQENLVPNPSFEVYDTCPNNTGQINFAVPWFNPTQGTPDYLNSCVSYLGVPGNFWGYQNAHSGNAYAGILASFNDTSMGISNYREYLEVRLNTPLNAGIKYFITFYLSLADSMNFATDRIGVCFSNDTIKNDSIYGYILYDTAQVENVSGNYLVEKSTWIKISGTFVAEGGESFLTIGNFYNDINTNTINVSGGASPPISDWSGGYYYVDDVCVSTDSLYSETWTGIPSEEVYNSVIIYPNPGSSFINIEGFSPNSKFHLLETSGRMVMKGLLIDTISQINIEYLQAGIYFLILNNEHCFKLIINH